MRQTLIALIAALIPQIATADEDWEFRGHSALKILEQGKILMQDFWGDEGWGDWYQARYYVVYKGDAYYCNLEGHSFRMAAVCDLVELTPKYNTDEIPDHPIPWPEDK